MKNLFKGKEKEDNISENLLFDELKNYINTKFTKFEKQAMDFFTNLNFRDNIVEVDISLDKKKDYSKIIEEDLENLMYLKNVYVDLDYFERKDLEERVFKANVEIADLVYEFKIVLERDKRYLEEYRKLEEIMYLNNKKLICKYSILFERMYRIKILALPDDISLNDICFNSNIEFDFCDLGDKIFLERSLYWNIQKAQYIPNRIIRPSLKNIYYEYCFDTEQDYSYLVDEEEKDVFGIVSNKDKLVIYSNNFDKNIWSFIKLKNIPNDSLTLKSYNILNVFNLNSLILQDDFLKDKIEIQEILEKGERYMLFEVDENPYYEIIYLKIDYKAKDNFCFDRVLYLIKLLKNMKINCRVVL